MKASHDARIVLLETNKKNTATTRQKQNKLNRAFGIRKGGCSGMLEMRQDERSERRLWRSLRKSAS
jgi:hypothetical protein